jgi:hypothetical protein
MAKEKALLKEELRAFIRYIVAYGEIVIDALGLQENKFDTQIGNGKLKIYSFVYNIFIQTSREIVILSFKLHKRFIEKKLQSSALDPCYYHFSRLFVEESMKAASW